MNHDFFLSLPLFKNEPLLNHNQNVVFINRIQRGNGIYICERYCGIVFVLPQKFKFITKWGRKIVRATHVKTITRCEV
jgi:hypothetical protein